MKAQGRSGGKFYSFFNLAARWGGWLKPRSGRFIPRKGTWRPLYRSLGEPQGRPGKVRKISCSQHTLYDTALLYSYSIFNIHIVYSFYFIFLTVYYWTSLIDCNNIVNEMSSH
jgi:hypothetical protein